MAAPLRLLIVLPSWLGDCIMATPALGVLRTALPGCFIGALARPGMDELFAGSAFFDEVHIERASGVMGPKFAAAKVRPRRYDTALLLTNSFSTALIVRIAGIPRRVGYDRDARGLLLTHRLGAPRTGHGYAIIPAVRYYLHAAEALLDIGAGRPFTPEPAPPLLTLPPGTAMSIGITNTQEDEARSVLERCGAGQVRYALLNPGGNKPEKRWPAERFAALADHLHAAHGLRILLNGSPAEAVLCRAIAAACRGAKPAILPEHGITIGSLKGVVRGAAVMVTNDTGPRHLAAALGVPLVSLFGPTDHRWTIIPTQPHAPEAVLTADPTLPETESANDHPQRCAIERITTERVIAACDALLAGRGVTRTVGG